MSRRRKGGAITRAEYNRMRKKEFAAAERAQELNKGKKPYRMDRRTVIYAHSQEEAEAYYQKMKK